MDEILRMVLGELRQCSRHKWMGLILAWIVGLVGWAAVLSLPDVYQASAKVYVDTESLIRDVVGDIAVESNPGERVDYVRERLLSRPYLERVARETDLDLRADTPAAFDRIVTRLRQQVFLQAAAERSRRASKFEQNLYEIGYQDQNPDTAKAVVRNLVNAFQEDALQASQSDQSEARSFLDQQIKLYEDRLEEAERKRAEFNREWINYLPSAAGGYFQRLQIERAGIQEVTANLQVAEERRRTLAARLAESREAIASGSQDEMVSPGADLERQISDLEFRLNELMVDYTEKHPDVIATREKLSALRERRAELGPDASSGFAGTGLVLDNLQMTLNETDVEIAGLRSRLAQHKARERELQATVDTVIGVEAELAQLNRDYEAIQRQFEQLVQRRERLILGGEVSETGEVKFEVLEPARVLPEPVAPDRPLLLLAVLGAAFAAGIGIAFFLGKLKPVFDSLDSLSEDTGLPVLGSVSMAWTPAQLAKKRVSIAGVTAGAAMLLVVFGVVFVTQSSTTRILQSLMG